MINNILIFGAGYVGSSLGHLLAKHYNVVLIDTDKEKVDKINGSDSFLHNSLMLDDSSQTECNLFASVTFQEHLPTADLVILALPTDYDNESNSFDTTIVESVLGCLEKVKLKATIVIRSTVPIGYTEKIKKIFPNLSILFIPEFLREGHEIEDNLNPSRIIIGDIEENSKEIAEVFLRIARNSPKIIYMNSKEAEAVKLFSNTYLAMRISFFNEMDSFALENDLNTRNIIEGISSDQRIGLGYNNPSFGYGGYCLPKDTKQLLSSYQEIPQRLISAVVESNRLRKNFIAKKILAKNPRIIGVYRLVMKKDSDNFRQSAIFDIIELLKEAGKNLIIYEPLFELGSKQFSITHDLDFFKNTADLVLANRLDNNLDDISQKVFSRDLYGEN